jgi:hypothetical protein
MAPLLTRILRPDSTVVVVVVVVEVVEVVVIVVETAIIVIVVESAIVESATAATKRWLQKATDCRATNISGRNTVSV